MLHEFLVENLSFADFLVEFARIAPKALVETHQILYNGPVRNHQIPPPGRLSPIFGSLPKNFPLLFAESVVEWCRVG